MSMRVDESLHAVPKVNWDVDGRTLNGSPRCTIVLTKEAD